MNRRTVVPMTQSLAILAGLSMPLPSVAQSVPYPVAVSGTPAPAGGNYAGLFFIPVLNSSGQVAFTATTTVAGTGLFVGTPGTPLTTAALTGTTAPSGGTYTGLSSPILSDSGQVAFGAQLAGNGYGLYAGTPGSSLNTIALKGAAAPVGGNYTGFYGPVINASGQVAFSATLSAGGSGMFAGAPGSLLTTVARDGTPSPAGANYLTSPTAYALNSSGQVTFRANLVPATPAIFAGTPGTTLTTVALDTLTTQGGASYGQFMDPVMNSAGQVAVTAGISCIFVGTPGSTLVVAAEIGKPAPTGGNYTGIGTPVLNASGKIAFLGEVGSGSGIFTGIAGSSMQTIASQLAVAPGTGGESYSVFTSPNVAMNNLGQVAFLSNLTGLTARNQGLFAGTPDNVILVVRKGDIIDVDPTAAIDNRTVSAINFLTGTSNESGQGMSFNDAGSLVYRLSFTDGSSGIFVSSVAVPEPATIALLAGTAFLGTLGAYQYRRREQRMLDKRIDRQS
jgi:hypothetical protein